MGADIADMGIVETEGFKLRYRIEGIGERDRLQVNSN
jgi:hypothetical protein